MPASMAPWIGNHTGPPIGREARSIPTADTRKPCLVTVASRVLSPELAQVAAADVAVQQFRDGLKPASRAAKKVAGIWPPARCNRSHAILTAIRWPHSGWKARPIRPTAVHRRARERGGVA